VARAEGDGGRVGAHNDGGSGVPARSSSSAAGAGEEDVEGDNFSTTCSPP
jgi:hypothetical protein